VKSQKEKEPRITRILAHHQENNIEDPDSSGISYKVPRNPRRTAQIEKAALEKCGLSNAPERRNPQKANAAF